MTALMESQTATQALVLAMLDALEEAQDGGDPEQAAAEVKALAALARNPEALMRAIGASDAIREAEACDDPTERGEGIPLVEAGFTGIRTDALGRKMYFQDGKHVAAPTADQTRKISRRQAQRDDWHAARRLASAHVAGRSAKILQRLRGLIGGPDAPAPIVRNQLRQLAGEVGTETAVRLVRKAIQAKEWTQRAAVAVMDFATSELENLPPSEHEKTMDLLKYYTSTNAQNFERAIGKYTKKFMRWAGHKAIGAVMGLGSGAAGLATGDASRVMDAYTGVTAVGKQHITQAAGDVLSQTVGVPVPYPVAWAVVKALTFGVHHAAAKAHSMKQKRRKAKADRLAAQSDKAKDTVESVESIQTVDPRDVAEMNRELILAVLGIIGVKNAESLVPSVDEMHRNMVEGEDGGV